MTRIFAGLAGKLGLCDHESLGKAQGEARSRSAFAISRRDARAHGFGKALDDCQPEPGAALAVGSFDPRESVERALLFDGQARPFVLDCEPDLAADRGGGNAD